MKIFSSFDTTLKNKYITESIRKYGKDNFFIMQRSKLYFYNKVVFRIITGSVLYATFSFTVYTYIHQSILTTILTWLLFSSIFYIIAIVNYIDYKMNYVIFTPEEATLVEQIGIFHRHIKTLDIKKIKSIDIQKSNIFFSIFNDGLMTIMSEKNDVLWMLKFKYVHNPEQAKDQIHKIIRLSQKQNKNTQHQFISTN